MADKRAIGHAYNIDFLNVVFAASSLFVLFATVWMVWDDYDREWKNYQRDFTALEMEVTRAGLAEAQGDIDQARVAELNAQRATAEQGLASSAAQIEELEVQLADVDTQLFIATQDFNFQKANYDVERYSFEVEREAAHADDPEAEVPGEAEVTAMYEEWLALGLDVETLNATRDDVRAQLAALRAGVTVIDDELTELTGETDRLQGVIADLEPSLINDYFLNAPMLDFLAPTLTVRQTITPNILDDVNFTQVPKMDRCETCHLAIDRVGYEEYPPAIPHAPQPRCLRRQRVAALDREHRVHRVPRRDGAVDHVRRRRPHPRDRRADGAVGRGLSLGGVASLGLPDVADRDGRSLVRQVPQGRGVRARRRQPERGLRDV